MRKLHFLIAKVVFSLFNWAKKTVFLAKLEKMKNVSNLASCGVNTVFTGNVQNIYIGDYTYINRAHITCGDKSNVIIGSGCAIGYNVSIKALTHSMKKPTTNINGPLVHNEKTIKIGNDCWIGDNVFIKEGVAIGSNVIVGANSVVTSDFGDNIIIAGSPAKLIKERNENES
ncbi:acyltransferase [Pseudoalteromonas distincta]|jgi:maltose O-acetyltransferase|uniref:acyltransferase n=1 Tax=Pseudoalteromonas TaxID=53246 RepID=UPI00118FE70B|nr:MULTISPECIES: acyltransferase [Pseudoalteromonas]MBB1298267.1 acyltransferase [Pseudoalteromonas sp. SR41-7]TVU70835.1 acyltransferase [Pseudoalteromonas elyakovii]|tara:strand:+ start:8614 stop:9129 length:516 start_codon:yes stop_codon:yes gene_type:complete